MRIVAIVICMALLWACNGAGKPPEKDHTLDRERLLDESKRAARMERADIEAYLLRTAIDAKDLGTGTRVAMLRDEPGNTARRGQLATVHYRMELLDGTLCYASEPGAPEAFRIEMDDVESGLHEAIQMLSPGDSAIFIIPSHRAFGLIGDMRKVPMRSTVLYRIGLDSVAD